MCFRSLCVSGLPLSWRTRVTCSYFTNSRPARSSAGKLIMLPGRGVLFFVAGIFKDAGPEICQRGQLWFTSSRPEHQAASADLERQNSAVAERRPLRQPCCFSRPHGLPGAHELLHKRSPAGGSWRRALLGKVRRSRPESTPKDKIGVIRRALRGITCFASTK